MWGHLVNDRSAMHPLLPPFLKLATYTGMCICDGALFLTAIAVLVLIIITLKHCNRVNGNINSVTIIYHKIKQLRHILGLSKSAITILSYD